MRIVYSLLLAGLFILGYFACRSYICPQSGSVTGAEQSAIIGAAPSKEKCIVNLNFKDRDFKVSSSENFRFPINTFDLNEPSQGLKKSLEKVVNYLNNHSGRSMTINGYYMDNETLDTESSEDENLGLARANMVKSYFEEMGAEGEQIMTSGALLTQPCLRGDTLLMKGVEVKFGALNK